MFSHLELRVIATLAYSNQFEYPLTATEIWRRLVSPKVLIEEGWANQIHDPQVSPAQVTQALHDLYRRNIVVMSDSYWALRGFERSFSVRISRSRQTQQKQTVIQSLAEILQRLPGLMGAAVTGSVAVNNATTEDDIDVLIIARPHRLWLDRLLVLGTAVLSGRRVKLHHKKGNTWCFNLWLESDHLAVPKAKRTLYEAYEILQARFIWARPGLQLAWLKANDWVQEFVPHEYQRQLVAAGRMPAEKPFYKSWLDYVASLVFDVLNRWAYWFQTMYRWVKYQEPARAFETAFYHEASTKKMIYSQWRRLVVDTYQLEPEKPRLAKRLPRKMR